MDVSRSPVDLTATFCRWQRKVVFLWLAQYNQIAFSWLGMVDPSIRKACLEFHWMCQTCGRLFLTDLQHLWVSSSVAGKMNAPHQVCKNDFEGRKYFQGWTTHKVNCLCVYGCILPAIKETLFISVHYNWALMIEDRMRPPVGSEMEIWEVSNAMREIYGSYLKLIDAFGLHGGSVCIGMFCVSVGAVDHAANQWVLGLLLKIEKRNNNSHNVGTAREDRSGIKHVMWVISKY